MKNLWKKHPVFLLFGAFSLLSLVFLLLFRLSVPFAEWFATCPAKAVRFLLAVITAPLPFSLFEVSVVLFCLYGIFLLFFALFLFVRRLAKKALPCRWGKPFLAALLVLVSVFDLFVFTLAPSYFRFSTASHMGLDLNGVGEEEAFSALERLAETASFAAEKLEQNEFGETLAPYDLKETKKRVVAAANAFGEKHSFYQKSGRAAKTFLSSPLMTYTHISGVYGFFTGEANVNTNYPHFIVTATLAHETCHARGIAPENECNFLAAVILMESEDPYLEYCGASFLADDFISLCKKLDSERTKAVLANIHPALFADYAAYSRFFEPYRNTTASVVADKTNSAYLKAMGQKEGTVSYSRIQRLTAAYFAKETLEK